MAECIFCSIVSGDIPAVKVYEDEEILGFRDIHAVAPEHVLLIPKKHITSLLAADPEDALLLGEILIKIKEIAEELGLTNGFRVVNNVGSEGGQTVYHIHFHLIGGRALSWPPG